MNTRTRRFLLGSSLVLAIGLCTGLVAYYNGSLPLLGAASGPSEMEYLPAETSAVAYADVRSIMASEVRQKLKKVMPTGEAKDEIQAELGVDLEKDIDTVVAGFVGNPSNTSGALVLIRGRFNEATIEQLATKHGAKPETYRGKKLLLSNDFPSTRDSVATSGSGGLGSASVEVTPTTGGIAFLEPGLVAFGDAAALKKGIDAAADRKSMTAANTPLMAYINDVQRNGNAWIVGKFDELAKNAAIPGEVKQHIPAVEWFAATARLNGGIAATLRADALDDKGGEDLRAIVNGGLAAARMMSGKDPKIESMLNSLQITGTGKTVGLSFTITSQTLDALLGMAGTIGK